MFERSGTGSPNFPAVIYQSPAVIWLARGSIDQTGWDVRPMPLLFKTSAGQFAGALGHIHGLNSVRHRGTSGGICDSEVGL